MISIFRRFAKSWIAAVLIGLLIVSFAIFGIHDVFTGMKTNTVVKAGSRELTSAEFARAFSNRKEDIQRRNGNQPISTEVAVEHGLDRQVLDLLANGEAFAELTRRMGVRVSDAQVAAEIRKNSAFFDPVSGKFDPELYAGKLREQQLTRDIYEDALRSAISTDHVLAALFTGLKAPRVYAAIDGAYALEGRDLSFFLVDPRSVEQPARPTDAQLQAFMKENAAQFTLPEFRQLTLVRFSAQAAEPSATVDEAELKKRYDFRKDTLSKPEVRTIAQVPAKDAAAAALIRQKLMAGADPAAVAKAAGGEPVIYADKPMSAIVDRKVAQAAFALKAGEVSAPIQGELGLAVVKVLKVTPGKTVTYEEARPDLVKELRADTALKQVYALTEVYDDAHASGATLTEAAQKAGAPAVALPPITAQGQLRNGQKIEIPEAILKAAFDLPAGGESDVQELGKGEYYAVRVEKVMPPALLPLAEIKPQLTQVFMLRELAKRMQAKADALSARVTKGENLEAVAASIGAKVHKAPGISRLNARNYQALGEDFLGKVFGAGKGDVFVAKTPQFGYAVVRMDAIKPAPSRQVGEIIAVRRDQLLEPLFGDLQQSAERYARRVTKTRTDIDRARLALGIDPKQVPGLPKANETGKTGESEK